jgi:16S rRNA (cytosine1402-N4)-methyltransferase
MLPNVLQRTEADHIPVLAEEVRELLAIEPGQTVVDATFGAGGHAAVLAHDLKGDGRFIAIDRDPTVRPYFEGFKRHAGVPSRFLRGEASVVLDQLADNGVHADAILLDLGVSSMQLDRPERGFSFMQDGPLDMRMGAGGPTASDIVNTLSEAALADIIGKLGEERKARAIAKAIVARRSEQPLTTTGELANLVAKVLGRKRDETKHPATRTFQALRLFLNEELTELAHGLAAAERLLEDKGRLAIVTFHSLEDRIAKRFLASRSVPPPRGSRHLPEAAREILAPSFQLLNRRPLEPGKGEIARNPRARSARLRAAMRTAAPAHPLDLAALGVPGLKVAM